MSQPVGNCLSCGGDEPFEQIHVGTCPDTGGDCPEWACVSCGAAVIMGILPTISTDSSAGAGTELDGQTVRAA
jgi:hypothetical protein